MKNGVFQFLRTVTLSVFCHSFTASVFGSCARHSLALSGLSSVVTTEERSTVEVRRRKAPVLDFRRISVFWGFSGRRMRYVSDQTHWNRGPDFGIIDRVVCRSTDYDVKWQIPANYHKDRSL